MKYTAIKYIISVLLALIVSHTAFAQSKELSYKACSNLATVKGAEAAAANAITVSYGNPPLFDGQFGYFSSWTCQDMPYPAWYMGEYNDVIVLCNSAWCSTDMLYFYDPPPQSCPPPLLRQNPVPPYDCIPAFSPKNLGPQNCDNGTNPINGATGNKYQLETDYVGGGPFPLKFQRYYNSTAVQTGAIGANWQSSYADSLAFSTQTRDTGILYQSQWVSVLSVQRASGVTYTFTRPSGSSAPWAGDPDVNISIQNINENWQLTLEDNSIETYNSSGKLLSIQNANGLTQTLSYDSSGRLAQVSDPFKRSLSFYYLSADANANIDHITLPDQTEIHYQYDNATGNLIEVLYPSPVYMSNAPIKTYLYEFSMYPHALTGMTDENGNRYATWKYDTLGRAISSEHAGGVEKMSLIYNVDSSNTSITDPRNSTRNYSFQNVLGVLKDTGHSQSGGAGCTASASSLSYDANGNITSKTDFNGNLSCYVYDLSRNLETTRVEGLAPVSGCPGNLAGYTPAAGSSERKISTTWHPSFRLPLQIQQAGQTIDFSYDSQGKLLKKTVTDTSNQKNRSWTYSYNSMGLVTGIDGPRTDVKDITSISYDSSGNVSTRTNALGQLTAFTAYDANGRVLTVQDPNGLVTNFGYDALGRLLSKNTGGEITRYRYDLVGQLLQLTKSDGSFASFSYDPAHRLTQISDSLGNKIVYSLDASSNPIAAQIFDATGAITQARSQQFDALNRVAASMDAYNKTIAYSYDSNGNVSSITDPNNHSTLQGYDALNRLMLSSDALDNKTQYQYDPRDNLVEIIDPRAAATSYAYDGLDNLIQTISPDTGTRSNRYDAAGNLITSTDARGKKTTYRYDALNRVTAIHFSTGTPITFTYDNAVNAIGRLNQMTDGSGTTQWTYDPHGRVSTKTQITGGVSVTTYLVYDSSGRLAQITYPSGAVITYSYDNNGQISALASDTNPILSHIQYAPFASIQSGQWANGQSYTRDYDYNGRIISYPLGSSNRTLSYDAASNIIRYTDTETNNNQEFAYDATNRLVSARYNTRSKAKPTATQESFSYDSNGNRLSETQATTGSEPTVYEYNTPGNHLSQSTNGKTTHLYRYDAAGNTESDGKNRYSYNDRGRLTAANGTQYSLNGLGQRVAKGTALAFTVFSYDEAGHLIGEYNSNGTPIQETVYLGDIPVATITNSKVSYIHSDHLNAPRAIVNDKGITVWRWDSEPFGAALPNEDPDGDGIKVSYNLRFPGQYYDSETGLFYNYFRDYNPATGRYIESDPIGLAGGINTYGYVGGNPVGRIDPTGENEAVIGGLGIISSGILLSSILKPPKPIDAPKDCPHDKNRKSLNDLINDLTNGGRKPLSSDDAKAAIDLGNEIGIPGIRDDRDTNHWEGGPHIHIPGTGIGHIPAEPQDSSNE